MTDVSELRGDRRANRAELVRRVTATAGPGSAVLVVVPRASAAQLWLSELLRTAPQLSGFVTVASPGSLEPWLGTSALQPALVVVENHDEFAPDVAARIDTAVRLRAEHQRPTIRSVSVTVSHDETPRLRPSCAAIRVHHRAVEADAALAVIHHWIAEGRNPNRLIVALPQNDTALAGELVSAAERLAVPVSARSGRLGDHPIVTELAAELAGATSPAHASRKAFRWWNDHASSLIADQSSVDVIREFIRALDTGQTVEEAVQTLRPSEHRDGVRIVMLDDALDPPSDQPWQGTVLVGCVDGTFPRRRRRRCAAGARTTDDPRALLASDLHRLNLLLSVTDPAGDFVAVSAPVGGAMPSPFLDGWPRQELALLRVPSTMPPRPARPTPGVTPVFATPRLRLSATQLTTFEDCSWRYAFEYGIGLRGAGGASATAGTLVHRVLERFLSPAAIPPPPRTEKGLLDILDAEWDHSQFPYSAQGLDYRRRADQWLRNWFLAFVTDAPDVRFTEHRFEVPFPPNSPDGPEGGQHVLVGSIDRVDVVHPFGHNDDAVRIIDYKSGAPKSQSEVDDDLQLAVYHYAATHDPAIHELGHPASLELHYLQDDASKERVKVMARAVTPLLEATTIARIEGLAEDILAEQFEPNADATCEYCAFHALCPVQLSGRRVP